MKHILVNQIARNKYTNEELKYVQIFLIRKKAMSVFSKWKQQQLESLPYFHLSQQMTSAMLVAHITNDMYPDQTSPIGAVWSGFIVFASMTKVV